jgi:hypothetical protein
VDELRESADRIAARVKALEDQANEGARPS